jgi:glycosidase
MANNHDVRRFMSLEGATLEGAMLHTAFTLSVRGTPQLYYGEELAMTGGEDPHNRSLLPGGLLKGKHPADSSPAARRMFDWTRDWIRLRREHVALRRGSLVDLSFDDDTYVFARRHGGQTVVVAFNRAAEAKTVTLAASALDAGEGSSLVAVYGARLGGTTKDGRITLALAPRSATAYRLAR